MERNMLFITGAKNKTSGSLDKCDCESKFRNSYFRKRSAYTWIENAHELRLTSWNNDPVTDSAGEAFYLRDEESGRFWSPACCLPVVIHLILPDMDLDTAFLSI